MSKEPQNFRKVSFNCCARCKYCDWDKEGYICVLNDKIGIDIDPPAKWVCDHFEGDEDE